MEISDINEVLKTDYDFCQGCKKYCKKDSNNHVEEQETRWECTFCDNRESTHEDRHYLVGYKVEITKERCTLKTVFVRESDNK